MEPKKSEFKKVQFAFREETLEYMDTLMEETDALSRAELMRNALRIYKWIVTMQKDGRKIHAIKENGSAPVELVDLRSRPGN